MSIKNKFYKLPLLDIKKLNNSKKYLSNKNTVKHFKF